MLESGALVLGKFKVLRQLGAGAMGQVYEVEHQLTLHRSALKVMGADLSRDEQASARFLREASAAGRVGNPHIVETYDAGTLEDGSVYLLMERLQGETLADLLVRGPLPLGATAYLLVQVAQALEAVHQKGIVHRDLKPANLFVTWRDGLPFMKVLDFGMSKLDESAGGLAVTQSGITVGTPLYMSPEQMRGARSVDARADVYSLGVIVYECLSGRRPYEADSFADLAAQAIRGDAPSLSSLVLVPSAVSALVRRTLAPEPEARLPSAGALAEALRPFASAEEARSLAHPVDGLAATHRRSSVTAAVPGRSRRLVLGAAASLAGLLVAFVGWRSTREAPPPPPPPSQAPPRVVAPPPAPPPVVEVRAAPEPSSVASEEDAGPGPAADAGTPRAAPPPIRKTPPRQVLPVVKDPLDDPR